MAKITTITNPLTGQPAQVDQLEHTAQEIDDAIARALPGGAIDITLQNKAPAGYGLGTNAVTPPNNSLDDAVKNGWYICSPSYTGAPTGHSLIGYGTVLVIERASDCCIQVYWSEAASNIAGSPLSLVRKYDGTTWSPWEWVNPPMQLGVEYRTTERYMGKPVYVKLIDVGQMPNTQQLLVSASIGNNGETTVIGFDGYMDNGVSIDKLPVFWLPGELKAYMFVMVNSNQWEVGVRSLTDLSAYTAKCIIKYTKIEG